MTIKVQMTRTCAERYSCFRCISNCFNSKSKQKRTNIITLDGVSYFTKEFLDLRSFHSTKAQAIVDSESDEEKGPGAIIQPQQQSNQPGSSGHNFNNQQSAGRNSELVGNQGNTDRFLRTGNFDFPDANVFSIQNEDDARL